MRRHRINRNFTKPEAIQPLIFFPSSFEQLVKALNISPEEYESSLELKEWVRRNKDHKYVPTGLLEAFGFHVNTKPSVRSVSHYSVTFRAHARPACAKLILVVQIRSHAPRKLIPDPLAA